MAAKVFEGRVVSNKMTKTIVVTVSRKFREERTGKIVSASKKVKVHSEDSSVKPGDLVSFAECRPMSKEKRFRLLNIIRKAETIASSTIDEAN